MAGDTAGWLTQGGYYRVGVNGTKVQAHVIVWEMHHGAVPEGYEVDHRDRNRANNLIDNLRVVTHTYNMHNVVAHADAACPERGLDWHNASQSWRGRVMLDGKTKTKKSKDRMIVIAWLREQHAQIKELLP